MSCSLRFGETMKRIALAAATFGAASALILPSASATIPPPWTNCTTYNHKWPHGVGRIHAHDHTTSGDPVRNFYHSTKIYNIAMKHNSGLDRDKDGIACEKH